MFCNLEPETELSVVFEKVFIKFLGFFLHFEGEHLNEAAEVVKDKVGDDLEYFFDDFEQLVGVELGDTLDIGTRGLEHSEHGSVKDGGQLQEGVFEEQGDVRVLFDFLLHQFDVVLQDDPAPSNIGNYVDKGNRGLFNVHYLDHVVQVFPYVVQVLPYLD